MNNKDIIKVSNNAYYFQTKNMINKVCKVVVLENNNKYDGINIAVVLDSLVDKIKGYDKYTFKLNKASNYDLSFNAFYKEIDGNLLISLEISFINLKFLEEEEKNNMIKFIFKIFDNLVVENNDLHLRISDYESYLESIVNNPSEYSKVMMNDLIYKEDSLYLDYNNKLRYLKSTPIKSMLETFNAIRNSENYYYYIEGSNETLDLLNSMFETKKENKLNIYNNDKRIISFDIEEVSKIDRENQVSMIFSFQLKDMNVEDEYLLKILNLIFGGNSSSKLFVNVREKENICYSIYSIDRINYGLDVVIEVDKKNIELAKKRIIEEFNNIKNGNIEKELEISKNKYLASLEENSKKGYLQKILLDKGIVRKTEDYNLELIKEKVGKINIEDVVELANKMNNIKILAIS